MEAINRVAHLLGRSGTQDGILPPAALYNEGWMLRLVLDWASEHRQTLTALKFEKGSTWYSEALLPSRFKPKYHGDVTGEGPTHADGVIGHLLPNPSGGGYVQLRQDARQFVVIEAKMASGLSVGTKNAPLFHQAARTVAALAHLISIRNIEPSTLPTLGFVLLAPETQIAQGVFEGKMEKEAIHLAVTQKAASYNKEATLWAKGHFQQVIRSCIVSLLSWEGVLSEMRRIDPKYAKSLGEFYEKCLLYNHLQ